MCDLPVPAGPIRQAFSAPADPFQAGQVAERRGRDRGRGQIELGEGLGDREGGLVHAGAGVGLVAGGDLGVDERAQELFR